MSQRRILPIALPVLILAAGVAAAAVLKAHKRTVAPEALSKLGTLSHLTQLGLPRADEQIMKYVVTLPQLTRFSAPQVVGGRALELVSGMSQLRELDLSQTALGASEVRLLGKLESLEGLTLNTIQAPGSLAPLSKLRHLRRLSLAHSQLNAADVGVIAQLSELRELDLSDTSLTDAGLEALSKLKQLRVLYIDRTAITRQGQATLLSFPKLTFTGVDGTALSCKELMTASTRLTCQGR